MEKVGSDETGRALPVRHDGKQEDEEKQSTVAAAEGERFYLKNYVSHPGEHGKDVYLKMVIRDGRLYYKNKSDKDMIRRETSLSEDILGQIHDMIYTSGIMDEYGEGWPEPDFTGNEELLIEMGGDRIDFKTRRFESIVEIIDSNDSEGLGIFYTLVQELKPFLINLAVSRTRINPFR